MKLRINKGPTAKGEKHNRGCHKMGRNHTIRQTGEEGANTTSRRKAHTHSHALRITAYLSVCGRLSAPSCLMSALSAPSCLMRLILCSPNDMSSRSKPATMEESQWHLSGAPSSASWPRLWMCTTGLGISVSPQGVPNLRRLGRVDTMRGRWERLPNQEVVPHHFAASAFAQAARCPPGRFPLNSPA